MIRERLCRLFEHLQISKSFSKNVGFIFAANVVNNLTIFAANVIIARRFGHEVFGLFSVAVNVALTTLMFAEFGMNLTLVRLYKMYQSDPIKSKALIFWNLYFKLVVFAGLVVIAIVFGRFLSFVLLQGYESSLLVSIALVSGGFLGLWSFFKAYFQAIDHFKTIAATTVVYALLRLVFLGFFMLKPATHLEESLFLGVYIFPLVFVLAIAFHVFRKEYPFSRSVAEKMGVVGKEAIHYSKWVAISGIAYILIQKSMIFIVSAMQDVKQVSLLSAALVFTAAFSLINDSIMQVLFPRMAAISHSEINVYRKKLKRIIPMFFVGLAGLMAIMSVLMTFFLGSKFRESVPLFWVIGTGLALSTSIGFYNVFLHTLRVPQVHTYVNCMMFVVFSTICILSVKTIGLIGVAFVYSSAILVGELAKAVVVEKLTSASRKEVQGL